MILIHMMHHTWNFRFHPLEHGLHAYGPRGDQFNIWLQGSLFCTRQTEKSLSRFGPPLGRVTLYPLDENKNWWNRKPYVRCIICIENITWKSPMWNTPGGLRRKIAKKGQKRLFLAVLRPQRSQEWRYFKTKIFPVKFKVFKLYWRRPGSKRMFSFGVRNF